MKPSLEQFIDRMQELVDEEPWRAEDFKDYSKYYENESNLRSIWRKGVSLGKKMVFTSLVVSSTPFLLPPLVALSAIGFALSLPAGFVFVTYACTDKLMNTLLPMPSEPLYLESGTMSSDEEEYKLYGDEVDKGYEEDDDEDVGVGVNELKEDTRKELDKRIELTKDGDRDIRDDPLLMPFARDEQDTRMGVTEIVEEGGYEEDVGVYVDSEEQILDSTAIPAIVEGIKEAEDDISLMEREGVGMPKDSLRALLVEAEVGGRNEDNVEQVTEKLVFVPQRDAREEDLANVDEDELRNETTGLLERIRDQSSYELKQQKSSDKGKSDDFEQNGGIEIKDTCEEKGDKEFSVIPEEVKPVVGVVGSEGHTVDEKNEKGNEAGISQEQSQFVIERTVVVNVKPSGDHTTTDVHQGTGLDETIGTLIFSEVDVVEMADERGFNEVPDQLVDSLNRGEDLASEGPIDVSIDYHEIRIDSIPKTQHDETGVVDRESAAQIDKDSVNEEKIWERIQAIRTIVGYKTAPHASCVDELEALYVFTGIELPVSSKETVDLGDVSEKLHFLMSIVGVK